MLRPFVAAVRRPRAALALLAAATLLAVAGAARLSFDDDYRRVFSSESEGFRLLERISEEFGREENDLFLLVRDDDVLGPAALRRVHRLHRSLLQAPAVTAVYSLASHPRLAPLLRGEADDDRLHQASMAVREDALLHGRLVAQDGSLAILVASLGADELPLSSLLPILEGIAALAETEEAIVTGIPAIRTEVIRGIQSDQLRFNVIALAIAGSLALWLFRRPVALVLVGLGPLVGVVWTLGLLGWLGEPINVLNNVVPQLVLAVGFADAVHLLYHVRRQRSRGLDGPEAAIHAVRHIGAACALTSLTTAVGFGSLVLARVELVQRFGLACAAGALLSFVAVLAVVPVLASTSLGDRLLREGEEARQRRAGARLERWFSLPLAYPRAIAALGIVLLAGGMAAATHLQPDYRYTENLPDNSSALEAVRLRDRAFGGSMPLLVRVGWEAGHEAGSPRVVAAIAAVEEALGNEPPVAGVTSIRQFAEAAAGRPLEPGTVRHALDRLPSDLLRRWVSPEGQASLVAGVVPDLGSAELVPRLEALRAQLHATGRAYPEVTIELGGLTSLAAEASRGMIDDLARSLGFATLVIFGVMTLALRSLRLGLVSLVPNFLPLAGAACIVLAVRPGLQYASVAVLSIGLGLAVDDTIHFLSGYRRQRARGLHERAAVIATLRTVGVALCTTTVLLGAGLATLIFSTLGTIRLFGALLCVVLLFALVADLLFLPALLVAFRSRRQREV